MMRWTFWVFFTGAWMMLVEAVLSRELSEFGAGIAIIATGIEAFFYSKPKTEESNRARGSVLEEET